MYSSNKISWLKHFDFIVLDIMCLEIAFVVAFVMKGEGEAVFSNGLFRSVLILAPLFDAFVIIFNESFKNVLKRGYFEEFKNTLKHTLLVLIAVILCLSVLYSDNNIVGSTLYLFILIYIVISYMVRIMWKYVLKHWLTDKNKKSVVIITSNEVAEEVVRKFVESTSMRYIYKGIVILDKYRVGDSIDGIPVVADEYTFLNFLKLNWVQEVFINTKYNEELSEDLMNQIVRAGITTHLKLNNVTNQKGKKQMIEKIGGQTVLTTSINYTSPKHIIYKRLIDICAGIVGCFLTLLITIVIGPMIYMASPGPIFFTQERVGANGQKFKMYKFRSMYMDAEKRKAELMKDNRVESGLMFKLDFDPRIIGNKVLENGEKKTGIGDFIRRTSLDEFPQFYNVLKGDMSLVGTRPPTVDEWEKYELHHRARLATKPGITGMWQVSGRSNITDFEEVVKLDMQYIEEYCLATDFKIILKTILMVLKRDGSM